MVVIEQMLTKQEVVEYRKILSDSPWTDGKGTAMGMAASVKRNLQADASHASVQSLANRVLAKMGATAQLVSAALPDKIFPPCFNCYADSGEYGYHVDAAVMRIPGSSEVIRSDMSMTLFLSDAQEYEGGELIIATGFGEQTVKLSAGDAVVYPSSSLHKVTPVTAGQRLAVITWMQSMVPDTQLRETLYQLDQSIQSLLQSQRTDRATLDQLHNVYHNLIRQFAQV